MLLKFNEFDDLFIRYDHYGQSCPWIESEQQAAVEYVEPLHLKPRDNLNYIQLEHARTNQGVAHKAGRGMI